MADAEVGDDGYGEDPTVAALEDEYAALVGKDAGLYVPSGTMANQIALRILCRTGELVVAGRHQHVVVYEAGGAAMNAGVQFHTVDDDTGTFPPTAFTDVADAANHHQPRVGLVCVEQTHMPSGGTVWPVTALAELSAAATALGVPLHMDGARLFNASAAGGVAAHEYAAHATTVMSCLSKGLCAPVGSLLAGPSELMISARLERQRLGGAMRQAGVIAAAGLVALRTMLDRLADDHERARRLAAIVADRLPGAGVDPDRVQTNIVVFEHEDTAALLGRLLDHGVLAGTIAPGVVRLVTHHDVDDADLEIVGKALATS